MYSIYKTLILFEIPQLQLTSLLAFVIGVLRNISARVRARVHTPSHPPTHRHPQRYTVSSDVIVASAAQRF